MIGPVLNAWLIGGAAPGAVMLPHMLCPGGVSVAHGNFGIF